MKVLFWTIFLDTCSFDGQNAPVGNISHLGNFHPPFLQFRTQRNSKSRESIGLKCSTGLLMHDLIIDINIMIMQVCENDLKKKIFFWFFVLPFFQKKHKIKQSRDRDDLLINDENT
jgi:hypothetical protein